MLEARTRLERGMPLVDVSVVYARKDCYPQILVVVETKRGNTNPGNHIKQIKNRLQKIEKNNPACKTLIANAVVESAG